MYYKELKRKMDKMREEHLLTNEELEALDIDELDVWADSEFVDTLSNDELFRELI